MPDADDGAGVTAFADKGELWQHRRGLALDFWSDGPDPAAAGPGDQS